MVVTRATASGSSGNIGGGLFRRKGGEGSENASFLNPSLPFAFYNPRFSVSITILRLSGEDQRAFRTFSGWTGLGRSAGQSSWS